MKKNLVCISAMEDKGFKVAFSDGNICIWQRNPKDAFTLGFRVDDLYQVGGSPLGALANDTSLQSELWHQRFSHLHYKVLPGVSNTTYTQTMKVFVRVVQLGNIQRDHSLLVRERQSIIFS